MKTPLNPSGFLVVAVCNFDDIPIGFYTKLKDAKKRAKQMRIPKSNPLQSWDITEYLGNKILAFKNGKPTKLIEYRENTT